MKIREYKEQMNMMSMFGNMVKQLEYSPMNTLEKPRKDLHRNFILPQMDKLYLESKEALNEIEQNLIQMGYKNPDDVDIDELFESD